MQNWRLKAQLFVQVVNKLTLVPILKDIIDSAIMMCSYGPSTVLYWCNKSLLIISLTVLDIVFLMLCLLQKGPLPDVLCDSRKKSDSGISSWDWNLSGQHSTYHALFPRAWTVYDGMPL